MKNLYKLVLLTFCSCCIMAKQASPFTNKQTLNKYLLAEKKSIDGWCSNEKSSKMLNLILQEKPDVCVEIGVYAGSSVFPTALGLKYNKKGVVYAIDPWRNDDCTAHHKDGDPNKKFWGTLDLNKTFAEFEAMIRKHKLRPHVETLRMSSEEAATHVPEQIDILHIDGNHQEEACFFDTITYFPRVKVGGYIWFDDAGWFDSVQKKRTTKKSLDYLLDYCEVIDSTDKKNCVLLRKLKD